MGLNDEIQKQGRTNQEEKPPIQFVDFIFGSGPFTDNPFHKPAGTFEPPDAIASLGLMIDAMPDAQPLNRYIVHPGSVYSLRDGERHEIGFVDLCRLYGIDPSEAINAESPSLDVLKGFPDGTRYFDLFPRRDGDYTLPKL